MTDDSESWDTLQSCPNPASTHAGDVPKTAPACTVRQVRILPLLATAALLTACQAEAATVIDVRPDARFTVHVRVTLDDVAANATRPALEQAKKAVARFAGVSETDVHVTENGLGMVLETGETSAWDKTGTGVAAVRVDTAAEPGMLQAHLTLVEPVALLAALDEAASTSDDPNGVRDTLRKSVTLAVELRFPGGAVTASGVGASAQVQNGVVRYQATADMWKAGEIVATGRATQEGAWWKSRWLLLAAGAAATGAAVRYDRRRRLARSIGR